MSQGLKAAAEIAAKNLQRWGVDPVRCPTTKAHEARNRHWKRRTLRRFRQNLQYLAFFFARQLMEKVKWAGIKLSAGGKYLMRKS